MVSQEKCFEVWCELIFQVVWRAMQEEFIMQYKAIEDLIQRCYPGSQVDDYLVLLS